MSSESGEGGLLNGATPIFIASSLWKIDNNVAENRKFQKKMARQFFGVWPRISGQGVIFGMRATRKRFKACNSASGQPYSDDGNQLHFFISDCQGRFIAQ